MSRLVRHWLPSTSPFAPRKGVLSRSESRQTGTLNLGVQPGRPHHQRRTPRAFTLVEMLVAMVLTLIMVAAIAEFYAYVGDTVRDGRAMIEMSSQLRAAVQRLKSDFDQITSSITPNGDDGGAQGYFEYYEGLANDFDTNANGHRDAANDEDALPVGTPNGISDLLDLGVTNLLGDGDDFLAFTIRSGGAPFSGRVAGAMQSSQLAEVAWWVAFDDLLGGTANEWDFNEPRHVYRRQLLILPNYRKVVSVSPPVVYTSIDDDNTYVNVDQAKQRLAVLLQENDISLRVRGAFEPGGGPFRYRIVHNTLQDLARRENRFAHEPAELTPQTGYLADSTFPHPQLLLPSRSGNTAGITPQSSFVLQAYNGTAAESPGEDIVLSNVLAFDVQIYDPNVRLWPNDTANPQTALLPSDPGYALATSTASLSSLLGLGGYVDLGYARYNKITAGGPIVTEPIAVSNAYPAPEFSPRYAGLPTPPPPFSTPAQVNNYIYGQGTTRGLGCTYDTWTLGYERDGVFQLASPLFNPVNANRMDIQSNGVDDDGAFGVDDYRERETIPPYTYPLRGLQVKIRSYEGSTRQMRQATVTTDFLAE